MRKEGCVQYSGSGSSLAEVKKIPTLEETLVARAKQRLGSHQDDTIDRDPRISVLRWCIGQSEEAARDPSFSPHPGLQTTLNDVLRSYGDLPPIAEHSIIQRKKVIYP